MEELERLKQLKEEAMKTIDQSVKKKPCKTCKKKKEVTSLPLPIQEELFPNKQEIINAYKLMKANANSEKDLADIRVAFQQIMGRELRMGCCGETRKEFTKFEHTLRSLGFDI